MLVVCWALVGLERGEKLEAGRLDTPLLREELVSPVLLQADRASCHLRRHRRIRDGPGSGPRVERGVALGALFVVTTSSSLQLLCVKLTTVGQHLQARLLARRPPTPPVPTFVDPLHRGERRAVGVRRASWCPPLLPTAARLTASGDGSGAPLRGAFHLALQDFCGGAPSTRPPACHLRHGVEKAHNDLEPIRQLHRAHTLSPNRRALFLIHPNARFASTAEKPHR